jgi:hypothetical protein
MVNRFVVLPLVSVLVGLVVLGALGAAPGLVKRGQATHTAKAPDWLLQQAKRLGLVEQLARLGMDRQQLREAGQRLGVHSLDRRTIVTLTDLLGLGPERLAIQDTASQVPGRGVVGLNLAGLGLAGLVGAPFVIAARFARRRFWLRRRQPVHALR